MIESQKPMVLESAIMCLMCILGRPFLQYYWSADDRKPETNDVRICQGFWEISQESKDR